MSIMKYFKCQAIDSIKFVDFLTTFTTKSKATNVFVELVHIIPASKLRKIYISNNLL